MRILLTGTSGSGKSTPVEALAERGRQAVDLGGPEWSEYRSLGADDVPPGIGPGPDWRWRDEQVAAPASYGSASLGQAGSCRVVGALHVGPRS